MRRALYFLLLALGGCATLPGGGLRGDWQGQVDTPLGNFPVIFHFTDGPEGLECSVESPRQTVIQAPCGHIEMEEEHIAIALPSVGARYTGRIENDRIEGHWAQTGYEFKLDLERMD